ncbi:MAG: hypothetical protein WC455_20315 [Dehalococcoidia bacterium]|jgi:hypothetical protein
MPYIPLNKDMKPMAGDLMAVDTATWLASLGEMVCSTDTEPCHTYHGALVCDSRPKNSLDLTITSTLNVRSPRAVIEPIYSYLSAVRMHGGKYVIARPAWVCDAEANDQEFVRDWRKCINTACYLIEGQPYPWTDLWPALKAVRKLTLNLLPEKFAVYCWQSVYKSYLLNAARSWLPAPVIGRELCAAIHWERSFRHGDFQLIAEHPLGFWREITA